MVVLAVTLCTRAGKLLVSRQFVEMTRIRIEGLVAAFPKLLGGVGKQHTFVETENVRYVYQPLEAFYLVLITSKQSNIVEDLETLKLISKLVPEYCPHDEDAIRENPFDFIFAIDEVISLGYREQVSLSQVKTSMEMASHEYRLSVLIKEGKEEDAKAHMARKIEEMERRKADARRSGGGGELGTGFGGGSAPSSQPTDDLFGGPSSGGSGFDSGASSMNSTSAPPPVSAPKTAGPKMKMSLKSAGGGNKNNLLEQLAKEGEVTEDPTAGLGLTGTAAPAARAMAMHENIHLNIEEVAQLAFDSDGQMEKMQVNGNVFLQITDPDFANIRVHVRHAAGSDFQFKTHPKLHKESFLGNPDPWLQLGKGAFPVGNPLGVLKWRYTSNDEDKALVKVNCWPSDQRGQTHCNLEYELGETINDLNDLVISIPIPGSATRGPEVLDVVGETSFDSRNMLLHWRIDQVERAKNPSGAMEFALPAAPHESFFPIYVKTSAPQTYCGIEVLEVLHTESGAPMKYSKEVTLKVESEDYTIGA